MLVVHVGILTWADSKYYLSAYPSNHDIIDRWWI